MTKVTALTLDLSLYGERVLEIIGAGFFLPGY
jgi:hypothetical protein